MTTSEATGGSAMTCKIQNHPAVEEARRKAEEADQRAREATEPIRILRATESTAFRKFSIGQGTEESVREIQRKRKQAEEVAARLREVADGLKAKIDDAYEQAAAELSEEARQEIEPRAAEYLDALEEARPYLESLMEKGKDLDAIYSRIDNRRTLDLQRFGVCVETPFRNPTLNAALRASGDINQALEQCLQRTEEAHV